MYVLLVKSVARWHSQFFVLVGAFEQQLVKYITHRLGEHADA